VLGEADTGPAEDRLARAVEDLQHRRGAVRAWGGVLRLLAPLPALPDEAAVDGGAVEGALEDVLDALPRGDAPPGIEDRDFLAGLGVPEAELHAPFAWGGWTAGLVRRAVQEMARLFKTDPEGVLARATAERRRIQARSEAAVQAQQRKVKELKRQV